MATGFRGSIFDVDGVLVASPHERAWRDALKELMETQWSDVQPETSYSPERFTPEVRLGEPGIAAGGLPRAPQRFADGAAAGGVERDHLREAHRLARAGRPGDR